MVSGTDFRTWFGIGVMVSLVGLRVAIVTWLGFFLDVSHNLVVARCG